MCIVFSGLQQQQSLANAMTRWFGQQTQVCVYCKPNMHTSPTTLTSAFEYILINCKASTGNSLVTAHSYYGPWEKRNNVFLCDPVMKKLLSEDTKKILNKTQKPLGVMKFLVTHFSHQNATVLDICGVQPAGVSLH